MGIRKNEIQKALIIAAGDGGRLGRLTENTSKPLVKILGLSMIERVILTTKQSGIKEFIIVVGYRAQQIKMKLGNGEKYRVKITYIENKEWLKENGISVLKAKELMTEKFFLLMSDHIFDDRILKGLINCDTRSSVVLAVDRRQPLPDDSKILEKDGKIIAIGKDINTFNCIDTGIFLCSPKIFCYLEDAIKEGETELAKGITKAAQYDDAYIFDIMDIYYYIPHLRREIKPYFIDIDTKEYLVKAENKLIDIACKGTNDLLATYVNKPIENFIVRHVSKTGIKPNQITILVNLIAYVATFLFFKGYLLFASLLTFIVSFMDGVDGKLSRVKLTFSNLGKMEHAFDYLFEHSWYIALAVFLSKAYGVSAILISTLILFFDGFSSHCKNIFSMACKTRSIEDFGKIERAFRKFDGRKNSYIIFILFGILFGVPFYSLISITLLSFVNAVFYALRVIVHLKKLDSSN